MMHGNALTLDAAALSRRSSGLTGHYQTTDDISPLLAAALYPQSRVGRSVRGALGGLEDDLTKVGLDAATTFISSGGDVDALYEPIFKALQTLALAIPQPGGALVSAGISGAKIGTDAIRNTMKVALRAVGQYCPIEVSRKINQEIMSPANTWAWWSRAARDKFAEAAGGGSLPVMLAVSAWNAAANADNQLNVNVRSRLADALYSFATKNGAEPYQAAMVAYEVAKNTGATDAMKNYANIVGNATNPVQAWRDKVGEEGGDIVSKKDVEDYASGKKEPPKKKKKSKTLYVVGAVGLVGLALLLTSGGKKAKAEGA